MAQQIQVPVATGASSATLVGQKVAELRRELRQLQETLRVRSGQLQGLRNQTAQHLQAYHGSVAAINSRLQIGTTPGNPILTERWRTAQNELQRINEDIFQMSRLSNQVGGDSNMAAYLLDAVKAARQISGAVDEDHRQLRILEDETNQTVVLIERLLTELNRDIQLQQSVVGAERIDLNALAVGIKNGALVDSGLLGGIAPTSLTAAPVAAAPPAPAPRAPLAIIRFDRPNVAYEQALFQAVRAALTRRPDSAFELVAVSPASNQPGRQTVSAAAARRSAENVLRSLSSMGLPAERVRLSAATSPQVRHNEVHVYVR